MKALPIIIFLVVLNQIVFAQKTDCTSVHIGTFKLTTKESGTTIIKRNDSLQIEENIDHGVKMIFDIKWINNCTYELRAKEMIKGDPAFMGKKGDVLTIQIKEVKAKSYIFEAKSNFADLVLTREIEIL